MNQPLSPSRPHAILLGNPPSLSEVYPEDLRLRFAEFVDLHPVPLAPQDLIANPDLLHRTEIVLGTWGLPQFDADLLSQMPALRAIFYAAGSVKGFVTDALWDRQITVVSAAAANAVPVAEYTVGAILLSLKHFFANVEATRATHSFDRLPNGPGNFRSTVGIISLGQIGRLVIEKLKVFDHRILAHDPYAPPQLFTELGVTSVGLEQIFEQADVISLHAPWIPATVGMIHHDLLQRMKPGATFINTSRGALVREPDLFAVLESRPDLTAIIDVTHPEPPVPDSPFYLLPNIRLTPHIAGSIGPECARMGWLVHDELARWLGGQPLLHAVTRAQLALMA